LGIPDDKFDYDEYVRREFGAKRMLPPGKGWVWWIVSVGTTAMLVWWFVR
jgi:hypothetical protein